MQYEFINPSDPYTFEAEDHETASLTVFLLGTVFGAKPETGNDEVPLFVFGGAGRWFERKFDHSVTDGLKAKQLAVATALDSFMLGDFNDRHKYNAALDAIDDDQKREQFKTEWQDGRSSLNDIGSYAHKLANDIRNRSTQED